MFLLRSVLATSLVFITSATWAEVPLTLDAGLLDENQVHDVWGSVVRAWESGESEKAWSQAEALARARAEAGWPALYTASVQAETFSRSCLAAGRSGVCAALGGYLGHLGTRHRPFFSLSRLDALPKWWSLGKDFQRPQKELGG